MIQHKQSPAPNAWVRRLGPLDQEDEDDNQPEERGETWKQKMIVWSYDYSRSESLQLRMANMLPEVG